MLSLFHAWRPLSLSTIISLFTLWQPVKATEVTHDLTLHVPLFPLVTFPCVPLLTHARVRLPVHILVCT